jgi:hypothetical protein
MSPTQFRFYKHPDGSIMKLAARAHGTTIRQISAETSRQLNGVEQHGLLAGGGDGALSPAKFFRSPTSRSENDKKELADLQVIWTDLKGEDEGWVEIDVAVEVDAGEISKKIVRAMANALR